MMSCNEKLFVPWFTDQMNLDVLGSQRRQGLLGLESPSVKHIPSMLHVLSWQPETEQRRSIFSHPVYGVTLETDLPLIPQKDISEKNIKHHPHSLKMFL